MTRDGRRITRRWSGPRRGYTSLAAERRACAAAAAQRHSVMRRAARYTSPLVLCAICACCLVVSMAVGIEEPAYSDPFERGLLLYVTSIFSGLAAVSAYAWWIKRNTPLRGKGPREGPPPESVF